MTMCARVGEATLRRGAPYIGGALFDLRRTGQTIKARCQGTASQPYRVEVTIGLDGVERDDCTCPVGGRCKHVAALLLAWLKDSDAFVEVAQVEVGAALEGRSKTELIALIRQMLARSPDLESLFELPPPVARVRRKPADSALIRREVPPPSAWQVTIGAQLRMQIALGDARADGRRLRRPRRLAERSPVSLSYPVSHTH